MPSSPGPRTLPNGDAWKDWNDAGERKRKRPGPGPAGGANQTGSAASAGSTQLNRGATGTSKEPEVVVISDVDSDIEILSSTPAKPPGVRALESLERESQRKRKKNRVDGIRVSFPQRQKNPISMDEIVDAYSKHCSKSEYDALIPRLRRLGLKNTPIDAQSLLSAPEIDIPGLPGYLVAASAPFLSENPVPIHQIPASLLEIIPTTSTQLLLSQLSLPQLSAILVGRPAFSSLRAQVEAKHGIWMHRALASYEKMKPSAWNAEDLYSSARVVLLGLLGNPNGTTRPNDDGAGKRQETVKIPRRLSFLRSRELVDSPTTRKISKSGLEHCFEFMGLLPPGSGDAEEILFPSTGSGVEFYVSYTAERGSSLPHNLIRARIATESIQLERILRHFEPFRQAPGQPPFESVEKTGVTVIDVRLLTGFHKNRRMGYLLTAGNEGRVAVAPLDDPAAASGHTYLLHARPGESEDGLTEPRRICVFPNSEDSATSFAVGCLDGRVHLFFPPWSKVIPYFSKLGREFLDPLARRSAATPKRKESGEVMDLLALDSNRLAVAFEATRGKTRFGLVVIEQARTEVRESLPDLVFEYPVSCLALSPCGNFLAIGGTTKALRAYSDDVPDEEREIAGDGMLTLLQLNRSDSGVLEVSLAARWDAGQEDVNLMVFSPDGRYFVVGDDTGLLKIWGIRGLQPVQRKDTRRGHAIPKPAEPGSARPEWNFQNGKHPNPLFEEPELFAQLDFSGIEGGVRCFRFLRDGSLAVGTPQGTINLYRLDSILNRDPVTDDDLETPQLAHYRILECERGTHGPVITFNLSEDEQYLAVGYADKTVAIFGLGGGKREVVVCAAGEEENAAVAAQGVAAPVAEMGVMDGGVGDKAREVIEEQVEVKLEAGQDVRGDEQTDEEEIVSVNGSELGSSDSEDEDARIETDVDENGPQPMEGLEDKLDSDIDASNPTLVSSPLEVADPLDSSDDEAGTRGEPIDVVVENQAKERGTGSRANVEVNGAQAGTSAQLGAQIEAEHSARQKRMILNSPASSKNSLASSRASSPAPSDSPDDKLTDEEAHFISHGGRVRFGLFVDHAAPQPLVVSGVQVFPPLNRHAKRSGRDEEEEELQRAIRESERESRLRKEEADRRFDEDMEQAIAASLAESAGTNGGSSRGLNAVILDSDGEAETGSARGTLVQSAQPILIDSDSESDPDPPIPARTSSKGKERVY